MKKIPTVFMRDFTGNRRLVTREPNPECAWVFSGEGRATKKWDGTACLVKDGRFYKRYDAKKGKTPPADFLPAQAEADPETGHWPGWVPVSYDKTEDRWHREATSYAKTWNILHDGTYELVGPKIQGNPEGLKDHKLIPHGCHEFATPPPRDFDGLRDWLAGEDIEGIVWWHEDGRMAKIKKRDFGLGRRPVPDGVATTFFIGGKFAEEIK